MPAKLRKDLNGLRVRLPGTAPIYLMDLGKKRHIPNPQVYHELFATWEGVVEDINIDEISTGDPLTETSFLFKCYDSPKVFLCDGIAPNQTKRHIVSPAVMERYKFSWDHIHLWNVELEHIGIPDGTPIKNP